MDTKRRVGTCSQDNAFKAGCRVPTAGTDFRRSRRCEGNMKGTLAFLFLPKNRRAGRRDVDHREDRGRPPVIAPVPDMFETDEGHRRPRMSRLASRY